MSAILDTYVEMLSSCRKDKFESETQQTLSTSKRSDWLIGRISQFGQLKLYSFVYIE
jgi:hypothetical protein